MAVNCQKICSYIMASPRLDTLARWMRESNPKLTSKHFIYQQTLVSATKPDTTASDMHHGGRKLSDDQGFGDLLSVTICCQ